MPQTAPGKVLKLSLFIPTLSEVVGSKPTFSRRAWWGQELHRWRLSAFFFTLFRVSFINLFSSVSVASLRCGQCEEFWSEHFKSEHFACSCFFPHAWGLQRPLPSCHFVNFPFSSLVILGQCSPFPFSILTVTPSNKMSSRNSHMRVPPHAKVLISLPNCCHTCKRHTPTPLHPFILSLCAPTHCTHLDATPKPAS